MGCSVELLPVNVVRSDPDATVGRGDPSLPADEQGVKVFGTAQNTCKPCWNVFRVSSKICCLYPTSPIWGPPGHSCCFVLRLARITSSGWCTQGTRAFIARHDVSMRGDSREHHQQSLKSAPRGSSPGPGGCTYEHLKVLLDESDTMELLFAVCTSLAQSKVQSEVVPAIMGGQIGCAREARWWSERHGDRFFRATFGGENSGEAIHQGVRIGMRSIPTHSVHKSRAATDNDPSQTLLSIDGIGAYDHIFRFNVGEALGDAKSPCSFAICENVLCPAFPVQLG